MTNDNRAARRLDTRARPLPSSTDNTDAVLRDRPRKDLT